MYPAGSGILATDGRSALYVPCQGPSWPAATRINAQPVPPSLRPCFKYRLAKGFPIGLIRQLLLVALLQPCLRLGAVGQLSRTGARQNQPLRV